MFFNTTLSRWHFVVKKKKITEVKFELVKFEYVYVLEEIK